MHAWKSLLGSIIHDAVRGARYSLPIRTLLYKLSPCQHMAGWLVLCVSDPLGKCSLEMPHAFSGKAGDDADKFSRVS